MNDIYPCNYDITAVNVDDSVIEFNTGKIWYKLGCTSTDYLENITAYMTTGVQVENPMSIEELRTINGRIADNKEQDFDIEELTIIGLLDNEGSKIYLDYESEYVRETIFENLTGRECKYYQHTGILMWSKWSEVPKGTSSGFFSGRVLSEADINLSTCIYSFSWDVYTVLDTLVDLGAVVIAFIVVADAAPVVIANLQALVYYVKTFGVMTGIEMYRYLGVQNCPNGLLSWLQMDMSDGDSSLDDVVGATGTVWDSSVYGNKIIQGNWEFVFAQPRQM